jgi:hypothetical protein
MNNYREHNDRMAVRLGETPRDRVGKNLRDARIALSRVKRVNAAPGIHELRAAVESLIAALEALS